MVRAKFRCYAKTEYAHGTGITYVFEAMYDPDLAEDQSYSKYTPSGTLEILVDNPAVSFETGKSYYLDFTPVEEPVGTPA